MMHGLLAALVLGALGMTSVPAAARPAVQVLRFSELDGWAGNDHLAALQVFLTTCDAIRGPDWAGLCALAAGQPKSAARIFAA